MTLKRSKRGKFFVLPLNVNVNIIRVQIRLKALKLFFNDGLVISLTRSEIFHVNGHVNPEIYFVHYYNFVSPVCLGHYFG